MKRLLVCQQNRHQKVYGGLYICAVGLDILKFEQTSLFYSASYFNWGVWSFVSERLNPPNPPCGDGTVWKNFVLLFNAIDLDKCLGYAICQATRYVKLSVYKHDWAQSGVATFRLALC